MSARSGQVRVDIQLTSWNAFCYSQLRGLTGSNLLTFFLTYLLTFFLTCLLTFFLTYLLTYLLTFFLTYLLTFFLTYFWHSFWHISSRDRGWGPARKTELTGSPLRSGGTLASQDRGWGPARNSELTGSRLMSGAERLRSGAEHWTHRIAVDVRQGTLSTSHIIAVEDEEKKEEKEEETAHIKSSNPHLTGGEQCLC